MKRVVYLIGMMGAGKSTVGKMLSQRLGWDFIDMDREIERREGRTIPEIFASDGEAGFRQLESGLLEELSRRLGLVVATGGGAVLAPRAQGLMSGSGLVVYLRVDAETSYARTKSDRSRPNLESDDRMQRIRELLERRSPTYCATADVSFQSSGGSPARIVEKILNHPKMKALEASVRASAEETVKGETKHGIPR
ncbi:MAG: shikimate kinase [Sutterellaceae bacterium]|nr:shikimate kinase [Sutterellaceae bacterium]MDY2867168.1 shikimate kinase [Mesosutterella sp.]